jgi:two-component system LytT family response regulator
MKHAIIIDDHASARKSLSLILSSFFPELKIIGECDQIKTGYELIINHPPDILFLDIEMPGGSGFDLLRKFENPSFQVIITTGYNKHAVEAIKFSALDYLLKPISIDDLKNALKRASFNPRYTLPQIKMLEERMNSFNNDKRLAIPIKEGMMIVQHNEIVRIEADNNYSYFFFVNREKQVVAKSLKFYDNLLSEHNFFRVHQSHLINLRYLKKYLDGEGSMVELADQVLVPVARSKKKQLIHLLKNM